MAGKKKKKRAPLVMGIVLLVCLAMYGGLLFYNRSQEEQEDEQSQTEPLFDLESDQIQQITYAYDGETVAFVRTEASDTEEESETGQEESQADTGESETEEKKTYVWTVQDDPDFPLQTTYPTDMAVNLADLTYVRVLEAEGTDEGQLAEYGLDSPALTVSFTDDTGTVHTIYFGDANETTGDYYGQVEGMDGIYTFAASDVTPFQYHLNDMVTAEDMPVITSSAIESIDVETGGESWTIEQKSEGDLELDPTDTLSWFVWLSDGSSAALNEEASDSIASAVTGLSAVQCIEVDGTDMMDQYGLGDSAAVVTVHYTTTEEVEVESGEETEDSGTASSGGTDESSEAETEEPETETITEHHTFVFRIGSQLEDGTYYMNIDGSSRINTISQTTGEALLNIDMETILSLNQAQVAQSSVESVTVAGEGLSTEFSIEEVEETVETEEETSESGEETQETTIVYHYYRDGAEIEEDEFSEFYQLIAGFSADRTATGEEAAEVTGEDGMVSQDSVELTLTYHRKNGLPDVTVTFSPYNTDFYVMQVDGGYPLMVNKLNISKIWEYLG